MKLFTPLLILLCINCYAQNERVYLQLDKYVCHPGDTVWFKGTVFSGKYPSTTSTNLYVELFTEQGVLLHRGLFPIMHGMSIGQLRVPDSLPTNNYYLRAFTRLQLNFDTVNLFSVPVLVYNKAMPHKVYHKKEVNTATAMTAGMIDGVYWVTSDYKGQLSSMVSMDTGSSRSGNYHIIKQLAGDSILRSDVVLSPGGKQQYVLFPRDTTAGQESLLLLKDSIPVGRQLLQPEHHRDVVQLTADTLDTGIGGYNSWKVDLSDTVPYTLAVSVTDADRSDPPPSTIYRLYNSFTEDLTVPLTQKDNSYISFNGKATREFGKRIKDEFSRDILLAGVRDSSFLFTKVVKMDPAGNFKLDSLFFFDDMDLQFQINKQDDGSTKDIQLRLTKFIPPAADSAVFAAAWEDDSNPIGRKDTVFSRKEQYDWEHSRIKTLKALVVKGWKSPRKELDNKYTSGAFSEPAIFSFDVRTERRFHDLGSYLRHNFAGFQGGYNSFDTPYDAMHHPYLFYVDEQLYTWPDLGMFDWERIAYIKCFQSDFIGDDPFTKWKTNVGGFVLTGSGDGLKASSQPTPYIIAIYTRKGTDFRTMPGGLNKIAVKGYSPVLKFSTDRSTLYWDPTIFANSFRVRFTNNEETRRYRIVIEGVNYKGQIVRLEKVIESPITP